MTFKLEVLQAEHGDSLLLHYGTAASPKLSVIDGGPNGVWKATLRDRLLSYARGGKPVAIDMLMVSHIDDDHVAGVVDLLEEMREDQEDDQPARFAVDSLWINTFSDTLGVASATDVIVKGPTHVHFRTAFAASVKQARNVRGLAKALHIPGPPGFKGLIQAPERGKKVVALGGRSKGAVRLTVVAPNATNVKKLRADWREQVAKL
jgi:hypothetical protein